MRIFKVNENVQIVCESVGTRYGFRHDAKLTINGYEKEKAKMCYHNRTWEKFEFETVIAILLEQTSLLTENEKEQFKK
jgi:hypothetical protein